jgi:hypothetical protein
MANNVYVIDFGNKIKIGQSISVKSRIRNIENMSGCRAVGHFSIETDGRYETLMHKLLSEFRGVGEYFEYPFEYAVSLLKSLVKNRFSSEIKDDSQLFLPLTIEKKVYINTDSTKSLNVNEIGEILGIKPKTAKMRLSRKGIKPIGYSGPTAVYDPSVVEQIKEVAKGGRPKKAKE